VAIYLPSAYASEVLSRVRRAVIGASLVVALASSCALAGAPRAGAAAAPKTVLMYGDSILFESTPVITHAFAGKAAWNVRIRGLPGSAPCDWLPQLTSDLRHLHPDIVVLETMGNDLTACITRASPTRGSPAYFRKYTADIRTYFAGAKKAGAHVLFVQPLPVVKERFTKILGRLTNIAKAEAAEFGNVTISGATRRALAEADKFTATKPCLAGESASMGCNKATSRIVVRAPDHLHLCPTGYPTDASFFAGCPVYSSGSVRYGKALASAVQKLNA